MKKYILPLLAIAIIGLYSCNENTEESSAPEMKKGTEEMKTISSDMEKKAKTEMKNEMEPAVVANPTTLKVDRVEHDFGAITDEAPVTTKFTLTNTGENPLIISSAKGSCGCTVPSYPKAPIEPGQSEEIEVSFNPKGKTGAQNKTVTIIANTEPANTVLNIKSVVNKIEQ